MKNTISNEVLRIQELMGVKKFLTEEELTPTFKNIQASVAPPPEFPWSKLTKAILPNFLKKIKLEIKTERSVGLSPPQKKYYLEHNGSSKPVTEERYNYFEDLKSKSDSPGELENLLKNKQPDFINHLLPELKLLAPEEYKILENNTYEDVMLDTMKNFVKASEKIGTKIDKKNLTEREIYKLIDNEVNNNKSISQAIENVTGIKPNTIEGELILAKIQENYTKFLNGDKNWKPLVYNSISENLRKNFQNAIRDSKTKPSALLDFLASNKTIFNFVRKHLTTFVLRITELKKGTDEFQKNSIDEIIGLLNRKVDEFGTTPIGNIEKFESELRLIATKNRFLKYTLDFPGAVETLNTKIGEELKQMGFEASEVDSFVKALSDYDPFSSSPLVRGWFFKFLGNTASAKEFKNFIEVLKIKNMGNKEVKEDYFVKVKDENGKLVEKPGTHREFYYQNLKQLIERVIIQTITGIPKLASEYRAYFSTSLETGGVYETRVQGLIWLLVHTWFGLNVANPIIDSIYSLIGRTFLWIPANFRGGEENFLSLAKNSFKDNFKQSGLEDSDFEGTPWGLSVKIFGWNNYFLQPGLHGAPKAVYKVLDKLAKGEWTYNDLKDLSKEEYETIKPQIDSLSKNMKGMNKETLVEEVKKIEKELEEVKNTEGETASPTEEGLKKYIKSLNKEYKEESWDEDQKYGMDTEGTGYCFDNVEKKIWEICK